MATTPKPLLDPTTIAASTTTYYTVPTATTTIIKHFALHNTSASPVQVTVYLVESGGTAGVGNQLFKKTLAALESLQVFAAINATLETGASIQCSAGTGSVVSLHVSGNEVT